MSNPSYQLHWEKISEKAIGKGGQGEVFHVRKRAAQAADSDDMTHAIRMLGSGIDKEERAAGFKVLKNHIEKISHGISPENQGALKVLLKPEDAKDPANAEQRMKRELEAMVQVTHPNLLKILDHHSDDKWFVSEFHPGGTLERGIRNFKGSLTSSLSAIRPVVEGVAELHDSGFVHRDIKPQNIFVATDGRLVLGDFGLVYFAGDEHARLSESLDHVGSWEWMPEWAKELTVDEIRPTFDVYCLAEVIWAMVSNLPRLNLWYFDKSHNNVEKLFPDSPGIKLANPLFAKCIVEEEKDCLPNARMLLDEIDQTLQLAHQHSRGQKALRGFREVFETRSAALTGDNIEEDVVYRYLAQLSDIHIVILSMLYEVRPEGSPWLSGQTDVAVEGAHNDLLRLGMITDRDNLARELKKPAAYGSLYNILTPYGKTFIEFVLSRTNEE